MQRPSTARQRVSNASQRVHRLSPLPPTSAAFAESMTGGISRRSEIVAWTNRNGNFSKSWGVTNWVRSPMASVCVQCRRICARDLHRGPASTALNPVQVCSISGAGRSVVSGSFGKCKLFCLHNNHFKGADAYRWERITMACMPHVDSARFRG